MNIKTLALILTALLLALGLVKFLGYQKEKHAGSSNYVQESVNAVKNVETMQDERAKTISEQERELESWE